MISLSILKESSLTCLPFVAADQTGLTSCLLGTGQQTLLVAGLQTVVVAAVVAVV